MSDSVGVRMEKPLIAGRHTYRLEYNGDRQRAPAVIEFEGMNPSDALIMLYGERWSGSPIKVTEDGREIGTFELVPYGYWVIRPPEGLEAKHGQNRAYREPEVSES